MAAARLLGHARSSRCTTSSPRRRGGSSCPRFSRPGPRSCCSSSSRMSWAGGGRWRRGPSSAPTPPSRVDCQECHRTRPRSVERPLPALPRSFGRGPADPVRARVLRQRRSRRSRPPSPTSSARSATSSTGAGRRASPAVDQAQCASCHFRAFSGHPEFAVLRRAEPRGARHPLHPRPPREGGDEGDGGRGEGHLRHLPRAADGGPARPHARPRAHRLRQALRLLPREGRLDRHHRPHHPGGRARPRGSSRGRGSGASIPTSSRSRAAGSARSRWRTRTSGCSSNLRKLRREIDPAGYAAERGALLARQNQLERRLAQATPLAARGRGGPARAGGRRGVGDEGPRGAPRRPRRGAASPAAAAWPECRTWPPPRRPRVTPRPPSP